VRPFALALRKVECLDLSADRIDATVFATIPKAKAGLNAGILTVVKPGMATERWRPLEIRFDETVGLALGRVQI